MATITEIPRSLRILQTGTPAAAPAQGWEEVDGEEPVHIEDPEEQWRKNHGGSHVDYLLAVDRGTAHPPGYEASKTKPLGYDEEDSYQPVK